MVVASDPSVTKAAGIFAAGMALLLFLFWAWMWPGGVICAVSGGIFLLLAGGCLTYRHVVHIDPDSNVVEQHRSVLFHERNRGFLFSDFQAIGVAAALGGDLQPVHLAHVIELRGRTRLILPGLYPGQVRARTRAVELGMVLGLTVEDRVRTIFFR